MDNDTEALLPWLLEGDISIRYQVTRDLLGADDPRLRRRILREGWGRHFIDLRNPGGGWGKSYYSPKWISTHYTLMDLMHLGAPPDDARLRRCITNALRDEKGDDGGINPSVTRSWSDICVTGMFLGMACYFGADEAPLRSIVDLLLANLGPDGGFNCETGRDGRVRRHSSLHTTLSVLEGFHEYHRLGHSYRRKEIGEAEQRAREFILLHRLFLSDRTGAVIDNTFLRFTWPYRWKFTILRALDYFRTAGVPFDARMTNAIAVIYKKRNGAGTWKLQSRFPGREHFAMEAVGVPSRWITMVALRVLDAYGCAAKAAGQDADSSFHESLEKS